MRRGSTSEAGRSVEGVAGAARPFQRDMSAPLQDWRFCVGRPDAGLRLDRFLAQRVRWRSRSELRRLIEAERVQIAAAEGEPMRTLRASTRLRRGQQVTLWLDAAQCEEDAETAATFEPEIVFEDEHLLVVNKPPLVNLYPSPRHRSGSLIEQLHRSLQQSLHQRDAVPPSPCHRLDRETSGLLLFAKDRPTRSHLGRQFEGRTLTKTYLAIVEGTVVGDSGCIDLPLDADLDSSVQIKRAPTRDGQLAVTRWQVQRRLAGHTLLALSPETGRQHQLRVHLAAIGHPIVGDKLYGGGDDLFLRSLEGGIGAAESGKLGLSRQALHSWRLAFEHPASGERRELEAPLWPDLAALIAC